ncbi:MAG TPA: hypothetical protein VKQ29_13795 [Aliidongia sp.]|nr:hypothetical protein [Aliidongia sp.]
MRSFNISVPLAALVLLVLGPGGVAAQVVGAPSPDSAQAAGGTAPRGRDTPVPSVPGTVRAEPPNVTPTLPTVDSSGANRSNESTTGEVKPPVGAPRLPGEPQNPPTGPDD